MLDTEEEGDPERDKKSERASERGFGHSLLRRRDRYKDRDKDRDIDRDRDKDVMETRGIEREREVLTWFRSVLTRLAADMRQWRCSLCHASMCAISLQRESERERAQLGEKEAERGRERRRGERAYVISRCGKRVFIYDWTSTLTF